MGWEGWRGSSGGMGCRGGGGGGGGGGGEMAERLGTEDCTCCVPCQSRDPTGTSQSCQEG